MPNIQSAVKNMRKSAKAHQRNRSEKTHIHSAKRLFMAAVESKDKGKALAQFRAFCSILDKAAKKGIIKANNASRRKQRASEWLKKMA